MSQGSCDWVLSHDGTHYPAGTMERMRCGEMRVLPQSISGVAMLNFCRAFTGVHIYCPPSPLEAARRALYTQQPQEVTDGDTRI